MSLKSLLIVGCIFSACAKKPPHVKSCYESTKAFVLVVKKELGMDPLGQGGFFKEGAIDSFYADFSCMQELSEEAAKILLFSITEKFLHHINGDFQLKRFLTIYPLTMEQLSISIAFVNEDREARTPLAQVHLYEGKIFYSHYDKEKKAYIAYRNEAFPTSYALISD